MSTVWWDAGGRASLTARVVAESVAALPRSARPSPEPHATTRSRCCPATTGAQGTRTTTAEDPNTGQEPLIHEVQIVVAAEVLLQVLVALLAHPGGASPAQQMEKRSCLGIRCSLPWWSRLNGGTPEQVHQSGLRPMVRHVFGVRSTTRTRGFAVHTGPTRSRAARNPRPQTGSASASADSAAAQHTPPLDFAVSKDRAATASHLRN